MAFGEALNIEQPDRVQLIEPGQVDAPRADHLQHVVVNDGAPATVARNFAQDISQQTPC